MTSIFVAKLDFGVDNQQLQSLFEAYGKVNKATVALDRETGKSRGFGFVEMFNDDEAQEAISQLDGHTVNNREIAVKQAEDRSNSRGPAPRRDAPRRDSGDSRLPSRPDSTPPPPSADAAPTKEFSKKKSFKTKSTSFDAPQDRGGKKTTKLNPYKKSGKDTIKFDDEDFDDEDFDLFGRNEDDDLDEDYSKYLVNADDDDDEDYDDDDFDDDEDFDDE